MIPARSSAATSAPTGPVVPPTPGGDVLWSVIVPAHNCAGFLPETLGEVVAQLGDRADAEIVVVDDGSDDDVAAAVRQISGDRVRVVRNDTALGAVPNFNRCLALASGELVHLLHGDDAVRPGFYAAMESAMADPATVAAVCRSAYVDEVGRPGAVTRSQRHGTGEWTRALAALTVANRVRPAAIVVRRQAYEQVGGFRTDLPHAADWEMWTRLAAHGPMMWVDEVLAVYRVHSGSDTASRIRTGDNLRERITAIRLVAQFLPAPRRSRAMRAALRLSVVYGARTALACARAGDGRTAGVQLRGALACGLRSLRPGRLDR